MSMPGPAARRAGAFALTLAVLVGSPPPAAAADRDGKKPALAGRLQEFRLRSQIFPGTERPYWVYAPRQYKPGTAAALLVVQDGLGHAESWNLPATMDQLIAAGEMPVTIGVFVMHGIVSPPTEDALPRFNRSFEYDGMGDRYVRMLLEELLPEVGKRYTLSADPASRMIAGASSGAIAAFTAAWERPDQFGRVFSTIGTYVGLRGGNNYPLLVRLHEPKPIRIFLADGSKDLDIFAGNWWIANQDMLSALTFAGYEVKHDWGDGGHNSEHGRAILADALRWLWKDHPQPIRAGLGSKQPVMQILLADEPWREVSGGHRFTEGPAVGNQGELYFTDIPNNTIHKIAPDGQVSLFARDAGGANGLMMAADGRLYAAQNGRKRIVAYDERGIEHVVASDIESNDLVITRDGLLYVTDPGNQKVWLVDRRGRKTVADAGIRNPNGIALSPDQTQLFVSDSRGRYVYVFQRNRKGELEHKQPYCHLQIDQFSEVPESGADGMTVDTEGRVYVTTRLGIQVCDQIGRVRGIIAKPERKWLSNVVLAGPELGVLYATSEDKVWSRRVSARGLRSTHTVLVPKKPGL